MVTPRGGSRALDGTEASPALVVARRKPRRAETAGWARLVSPFSDPGCEMLAPVENLQVGSGDSMGSDSAPRVVRSVSATASCGLRAPPSVAIQRYRSFAPMAAGRALSDGSSRHSALPEGLEEDSLEGRQPTMRHSATDPPGGRLELVVHTTSGVIRRMVEEERERWEMTQEQWLLAAKEAQERQQEVRKKWLYGSNAMASMEDQLYLHSSRSVCMATLQIKVSRMLQSQFFDLAIGLIIVVNAMAIGLEQTLRLNGQDTSIFETFEIVFLSIYTVEMFLRFFVSGWRCLKDDWVKFDLALLVLGLLSVCVITPLFGKVDEMAPLLVLRMFRLLRLARTVKLLMKFRNLWMLVRGLLSSASTMVPTLVLLAVILYIFGALGFELLKSHRLAQGDEADEVFQLIVETHFSSLSLTMTTLVQFISMDSVAAIYKPLIERDWTLAIYFHVLILLVFIVLMNLVTAVIVNSAFEQASQDREAQLMYEQRRKEKLVGELVSTFEKLDINGDGKICRDELMGASGDDLYTLYQNLKLDNPEEIFSALDVEGTGEISINEFCEGILQAVTSERSIELKRMDKQINSMKKQLNEMERAQANFGELLAKAVEGPRLASGAMPSGSCGEAPASPASPADLGAPPPWAAAMAQELRELRELLRPAPLAGAGRPPCADAAEPQKKRRGLGIRPQSSMRSVNSVTSSAVGHVASLSSCATNASVSRRRDRVERLRSSGGPSASEHLPWTSLLRGARPREPSEQQPAHERAEVTLQIVPPEAEEFAVRKSPLPPTLLMPSRPSAVPRKVVV